MNIKYEYQRVHNLSPLDLNVLIQISQFDLIFKTWRVISAVSCHILIDY